MSNATENLKPFSPVILEHMEQGSDEWIKARMGCITMSNAAILLIKGRTKNAPSATRQTYIAQVASEVISGIPADRVNTWDIIRGNLLEPFARKAYEIQTGIPVKQIGLGYLNTEKRIAASPDGLTEFGGVEIKCQHPKNHMKTILEAQNPAKFEAQMQGCMWVFGVDRWDYCSFCPEFDNQPLFVLRRRRDEEMIKRIEEQALSAVEEVDNYIDLATSGDQNPQMRPLLNEALELIEIMQDKEPEIE